MRILIHTDQYYPLCGAGAYRMKVLADALISKGHTVTVIASSVNLEGKSAEKLTEKVIYSPTIRMKKKTTIMRFLNNISFAVTSLFSSFKAGKADVVITTSPPILVNISGWIIAKFKKAKLVYDVRDIWPDVALEMGSFSDESIYFKIFNKIANFMYKHSDMITTVSPGKVKKINSHIDNLKNKDKCCKNVEFVGNGFDERILESKINNDIIEKYQLDKCPSCVFIGNIGLAQGLGHILNIAERSKHKDIRFLLFGTGAEKDILEKSAEEKGLDNVHFCGVLEHENVYTVLNSAKLSFISLKNSAMTDSIPTKMYESLGVGCPVLLAACGDSCDILNESKLGMCVSPDDPDGIVEAFDKFIDNYDKFIKNKEYSKQLMKSKYSRQSISMEFEKKLCDFIKM